MPAAADSSTVARLWIFLGGKLKGKSTSNPRGGDGSRGSGRWASGHDGGNEDRRTGFKKKPAVKPKRNDNNEKTK